MKVSVQRIACSPASADAVFSAEKWRAYVNYDPSGTTSAKASFMVQASKETGFISITFDADGGTADYTEKECTLGSYIGDLPTAHKDGMLFDGWKNQAGEAVTYYSYAYQSNAHLVASYASPVTVSFNANGGTLSGSSTMRMYVGHPLSESPDTMPTASMSGKSFSGWYTSSTGGTRVTSSTYYDGSFTVLYAHYGTSSWSVDLNSQWYLMQSSSSTDPNGKSSPYQSNPDSSLYSGVYASYSNYNISNGYARMRVTFSGYQTFVIYIRSYAESSYDYCVAGKLDTAITSLPSYSTGSYHTQGKQNSGMTLASYTACSYPNDGGEHFIDIVYRKDSSVNNGNDRGYVLIPSA